jgi:hypothetical protein
VQRAPPVGERGGDTGGVKVGDGDKVAGQVGDVEGREERDAVSPEVKLDRAAPY